VAKEGEHDRARDEQPEAHPVDLHRDPIYPRLPCR